MSISQYVYNKKRYVAILKYRLCCSKLFFRVHTTASLPIFQFAILTVHALYLTVIRNNILSTAAIYSLLHSMICVINRLLNDCCFLEHRYHDTIRRANSTSLSADRSPRQLSKAKKSGSSLLTACLRAFKRVGWFAKRCLQFPL